MKNTTYQSGQTLLEVVVVIAVVAVVLTGLISSVTAALRYGQSSQFRSQGVKLAQESLELARKIRDASGWDAFALYGSTNSGQWCLDSTGTFTAAPSGGDCPITTGSTIWRQVTFAYDTTTDPANPRMKITGTVTWGLRNAQSTVVLSTYLTQWK